MVEVGEKKNLNLIGIVVMKGHQGILHETVDTGLCYIILSCVHVLNNFLKLFIIEITVKSHQHTNLKTLLVL